jgi:hypothetical protein
MTKPAPKKSARKPSGNTVNVNRADGETEAKAIAATILRPSVNAAVTIQQLSQQFGDIDLRVLIEAISDQAKAVHDGDLKRAEAMLITQAHTLDTLFNGLIRRSALNMGEYIGAADTYMKLALRAQNQCRMTLETLATIKNPPIVYAKQANIANGPQQVNNGPPYPDASRPHAHAGKNPDTPAELLEAQPHEQLDTRTPGTTSRTDPAMATVE